MTGARPPPPLPTHRRLRPRPTPRKEARGPRTRDGEAGMTEFAHRPVMLDEIVGIFAAVPAGVILDATLGGGGHAEAILDSRDDLLVIGVDRDPAALAAATARLERFGSRFRAVHARFDDFARIMPTDQIQRPTVDELAASDLDGSTRELLSGALFDLGVSSPQLDRAERGFSFRQSGPLDMRMDTTAPWSASDVVNGYDVDELARIIRRYGDERFATRIARAIVAARPDRDHGRARRHRHRGDPGGHPPHRRPSGDADVPGHPHRGQRRARGAAPRARGAIEATRPGGRIAVLSYHSGEDRIAKDVLRRATGACDCPPGLPCVCGAVQTVRLVRGVPRRRRRPSAPRTPAPRRPACASASASSRSRATPRTDGDDGGHRLRPARRGAQAGAPRRHPEARCGTHAVDRGRQPKPDLRIVPQPRVAYNAALVLGFVVVVLMLGTSCCTPGSPSAKGRSTASRPRSPMRAAVRRAAPATRRAPLADASGHRGPRLRHGADAAHRVPGGRSADARRRWWPPPGRQRRTRCYARPTGCGAVRCWPSSARWRRLWRRPPGSPSYGWRSPTRSSARASMRAGRPRCSGSRPTHWRPSRCASQRCCCGCARSPRPARPPTRSRPAGSTATGWPRRRDWTRRPRWASWNGTWPPARPPAPRRPSSPGRGPRPARSPRWSGGTRRSRPCTGCWTPSGSSRSSGRAGSARPDWRWRSPAGESRQVCCCWPRSRPRTRSRTPWPPR